MIATEDSDIKQEDIETNNIQYVANSMDDNQVDTNHVLVSDSGEVNNEHVVQEVSDNGEQQPEVTPLFLDEKATFIVSENGEERVLTMEELEQLSDSGVLRFVQ